MSSTYVPTLFAEDVEDLDFRPQLLATQHHWDILEYVEQLRIFRPFAIVPPFNSVNPRFTSQAAMMTRSHLHSDLRLPRPACVGVRAMARSFKELVNFIHWARENSLWPIVIPPEYSGYARLLFRLHQLGVLDRGWFHLAGGLESDTVTYYGATITYGCEIESV